MNTQGRVPKKAELIADIDSPALIPGKIYEVMSVEKGWYRIMTEIHDDYLFPPKMFRVVEWA